MDTQEQVTEQAEGIITNGEPQADTDKRRSGRKPKVNPILAKLGKWTFSHGDGTQYPRQTGWGGNKKPHPDGGTNETAAFVTFRPFDGLGLPLMGRIYCERFTRKENGKEVKVRSYSVSLPFLKPERADGASNQALEEVKNLLLDEHDSWMVTAAKDKPASKQAARTTGRREVIDAE